MSKQARDHGRLAGSRPCGVRVFGGRESKSMINDVEGAVAGLPHLDAAAGTGLPATSVTVSSNALSRLPIRQHRRRNRYADHISLSETARSYITAPARLRTPKMALETKPVCVSWVLGLGHQFKDTRTRRGGNLGDQCFWAWLEGNPQADPA